MNLARSRGADALVQTLRQAGVRVVFSLSGNHIMSVYDALLGSGIRLIHTRHEGAAVHMADAYARLSGEIGVALVTGGPGHANAVSALYTALLAESPVLLLSGHAPNAQRGMGAFQEMRQADMAAPVTKASWTCEAADRVAGDVALAIRLARSGRAGPVHLSLPSDTLEEAVSPDARPGRDDMAPQPMPLAEGDARALLDGLAMAERPLILVGPMGLSRSGRSQMAALEAACGVPVIGMESPRGVADPSLGALADLLPTCDAVLLLGKRLDFTLKFGQPPTFGAGCRWLQVDADRDELDRARRALGPALRATALADTASALQSTIAAARAAAPGRHAAWRDEVRRAVALRTVHRAGSGVPGRLHPVEALTPLQAVLDSHPDAVLIADGGEFGQWAQACLQAPQRLINGVAGSIGAALPMAIGARCVVPDAPIVAVMGDGTFGFHAAEIDTAVRCGLPLVVLIGNDARWNAEHQIQLRAYGAERLIGCDLLPTRYDQVAAAFGGHGEWITEPAQLAPALDRALASRLPACLNAMIDGVAAPVVRLGTAS